MNLDLLQVNNILIYEKLIVYNIHAEVTYWNVNEYIKKEISESRGISNCKEVNQIMEEVATRLLLYIK